MNLVISEAVYSRHPEDDEGVLSARRAAIVSTTGLARLAHRIDLGSHLYLGEGEAQRGGRRRPSLLASAFEAICGALYLDQGYGRTQDWLLALAAPELEADPPLPALKSPKSRLQEYTQRRSGGRPVYRVVDATGPDHDKTFRVEVLVDDQVLGFGTGPSRRVAETAAAAEAIERLRGRGRRDGDGASAGSGGDPAAREARLDAAEGHVRIDEQDADVRIHETAAGDDTDAAAAG